MNRDRLRLGTRGSALALWQSNWVKAALEARFPELSVELLPIKTTGDKILDVPLARIGGKGLFTKELDDALLDGRIDLAVHSLKDVPFQLPDGIDLTAVPEREDPRDAFVSNGPLLHELPAGVVIGTSSLRRQVQLRHRFPAFQLTTLRGNVDTRLRKLASGEYDGIVLAVAGLTRLGQATKITQTLDDDVMLPALSQGALGIVSRSGDLATAAFLASLEHKPSRIEVTAERALLRSLGGSCQVPVAGKSWISGERLFIKGLVASLDGRKVLIGQEEGDVASAQQVGANLGQKLLSQGAAEILSEITQDGAQG